MEKEFDTVEGTIDTVETKKNKKKKKKEKVSLFSIFIKGLWTNNPGLCQLLGLCPLLAVTNTASNALGLALATLVVICCSSVVISLLRKFILTEIRIPVYVLFIATLVTVVRFYVQAYFPDIYEQLGIYLALIVTNCIIMGRAEAFAGKNGVISSFVDALGSGIGFGFVLLVLGGIREILGTGTLFAGASNLLGSFGQSLECSVISENYTIMVAILPPGGFFIMAFMIAIKNFMNNFKKNRFENSLKIKSIQN